MAGAIYGPQGVAYIVGAASYRFSREIRGVRSGGELVVAVEICGNKTAVSHVASQLRSGNPLPVDLQTRNALSMVSDNVALPTFAPRHVITRSLPGGFLHATVVSSLCRYSPAEPPPHPSCPTFIVQRHGTPLDPARLLRRLRLALNLPLLDSWADTIARCALQSLLVQPLTSFGTIAAWAVDNRPYAWMRLVERRLRAGDLEVPDSLWDTAKEVTR